MTWQDELVRKHRNKQQAAAYYLKPWRKRAPAEAEKVKQVTSLANKLGDLMTGAGRVWWAKRPTLREIVATDLGIDESELMGGPVTPDGLSFFEFPGLKPLASNDEPCNLGEGGWLLHAAVGSLSQDRPRWLVAAPGSGKSLVLRYLKQRHAGAFELVTTASLEAAVEQFATKQPLVVELEIEDPRTDPAALRRLASRSAPTVILAPFPPDGAEVGPRWHAAGERPPPRLFGHPVLSGWSITEHLPPKGWRRRLTKWIDNRLEATADSRFESTTFLDWLAAHDPDEDLVSSPGDLLALASELQAHGELAPIHELADRWIARTLVQPHVGDDDARRWCRRVGVQTFRGVAIARTKHPTAYGDGLTAGAWEALVPESSAANAAPADSRTIVAYLREVGLLRGVEGGGVRLFPNWVAAGVGMDAIRSSLAEDSVEAWGRLAVDPERRSLIDTTLDDLRRAALCGVVREVAKIEGADSLAAAAAIEATFAGMARRLAAGSWRPAPTQVPAWHAVARRQAEQLLPESSGEGWHVPVCRPGRDEWLATAWSVSQHLERPPAWRPQAHIREFPGWASRLKSNLFNGVAFPSSSIRSDGGYATPAQQAIAILGVEVLRRFTGPPEPLPTLLLPAYVEVASEKGWPVSAEHLATMGNRWETSHLARRVKEVGSPKLVELLWNVMAKGPSFLDTLRSSHDALLRTILDRVPEASFEETLREQRVKFTASTLAVIPPRLRASALRWWAATKPSFGDARDVLRAAGPDDLDVLLEVVLGAEGDLLSEVAALVWRIDPRRAREEVQAAIGSNRSPVLWFQTSPRSETPFLAALIRRPWDRGAWLAEWARARLVDAGEAGDVLYRIVRQRRTKSPL